MAAGPGQLQDGGVSHQKTIHAYRVGTLGSSSGPLHREEGLEIDLITNGW